MSAPALTAAVSAAAAAAATSSPAADPVTAAPSPLAYLVSFLLVGLCWGFTTPFIRRAALTYTPPTAASHPHLFPAVPPASWLGRARRAAATTLHTVLSIVRKPSYAVPLVCNLTGSVWFFILVGKAELSLTVPITNSLAFLFTVLGEYVAEGKLISRDTWLGMACVCVGIGICVWSKL